MSEPAPSIEQRIAAHLQASEAEPERPEREAPEREAPRRAEPEAHDEPQDNAAVSEDAPQEEEAEYLEIGDITQLAEHLGVDPAEVYNIAVPYTKGGEKHEFTLGEIKDKLQDFQDAIAAREQAESTYAKYAQAEAAMQEQMHAQAHQAAMILQQAEQALLADMQAINWQQLERDNPGEWARLSEQFRRKQGQLRQIGQQAAQQYEKQRKDNAEHVANMRQETLQREQQRLLRTIPEWRNDEVANTERKQLTEYLRGVGYTADELSNAFDHRPIVLARKAMLFDRLQKDGGVALKKVVKLPKKIVKPGSRPTSREQQHDRERAVATEHRKNPKSMDAAAARIKLRLGR